MSELVHPFLLQCNVSPIKITIQKAISLPIHSNLQKSCTQQYPKLIPIKINKRKFPQNFFPKYFSNHKINLMKIKYGKKRQSLIEKNKKLQKVQQQVNKQHSFINVQSQEIKNLSQYCFEYGNTQPSQRIHTTQIKSITTLPQKNKKTNINILPSCYQLKKQTHKHMNSSTIKQAKRKYIKNHKNQNRQQNQRKYIFSERLNHNDISNYDPNNITFYTSKITQLPILKIKNSKQI